MCNLSKGIMEKGTTKDRVEGRSEGMAKGMTNGILSAIKSLMETMGMTIEQAMAALKVPEDEKQKYMDLLERQ